jgi:hypothetical protein
MERRSQSFKLQELRAKTDRDLAVIIDRELDLALFFASLDETKDGAADLLRARMQISLAEAGKLLAGIENLDERRRLRAKWQQLREDLDRLSVPLRARTAHS